MRGRGAARSGPGRPGCGRRDGGRRTSRRGVAVAVTALGAALAATLAGGSAQASSHREAPLIAGDPKVDNTDLYAFVSADRTDSVTLIANWQPFEEPVGGPNFYPFQAGARYDINIDNNGDARADITYRWTFSDQDRRGTNSFLYTNGAVSSLQDENLLFRQAFKLVEIRKGKSTVLAQGPVAPSNTGARSMPDYAALRDAAITTVKGGGKTFAGQADDPFFVDLRVFDLLYGGDLSETGNDTLAGYNVNTIALQVPKSKLAMAGNTDRNPVIGIWSTTSTRTLTTRNGRTVAGPYVQVSRLGNPLVNEVVVPAGLKNAFNAIQPHEDHAIPQVVDRVTNPELPQLIKSIYNIDAPATPRSDLVEIFLTGIAKHAPMLDGTPAPIQADLNSQVLNLDADDAKFTPSEMLRLNMSIDPASSPNRLGVLASDNQGWPNGRRLTDDVVDIALQSVEGAAQSGQLVDALAAGDGVDTNDVHFDTAFPYVGLPQTFAVNNPSKDVALPVAGGGSDGDGPFVLDPVALRIGALSLAATLLVVAALASRRRKYHAPTGLAL
jgi:hypothetical protein